MNIFEKLMDTFTASGAETGAADVIKEYFDGKAADISTDNLGNLIIRYGELSENAEKTAVFTSIDAPGLIVTYIEENGDIKVSSLGKCDYRSACCSTVTNGRISGILVPDSGDSDTAEKSHVKFAFNDRKEACAEISEGDVLFYEKTPVTLKNGCFAGVGLGSKAAAAAMCLAAEKLCSIDGKCVYFIFCTQSELYNRGAYPAAFGVKPDKALCIAPYNGKKLAVKVLDKTLVCDKELTEALCAAAAKKAEDVDRYVSATEMSDAAKVQSAFWGVRVASVMMPARNLGSLVETVSLDDIEKLSDIIAEFLNNI